MRDAPRHRRRQPSRRKDLVSAVVGFVMFVGVGVFAATREDPDDREPPVTTESSAESAAEPPATAEQMNQERGAVRQGSIDLAGEVLDGLEQEAVAPATGRANTELVQQARAVLDTDEPVTVVVLGDSTGDNTHEWVHLWARGLAEDRPVSITHWDAEPGTRHYPVVELSTAGAGSPVMIWNGSVVDGTPSTAQEGLDQFLVEAPDVVLLNFGHDQATQDFPERMDALVTELRSRLGDIPVLAVVQNPQDAEADAQVREAGQRWAAEAGVGVLDVASTFPAFDNDLPNETTSTSEAGQVLWASIVAEAIG